MGWRILLTILIPIAVIGGYLVTASIGGFVDSWWDDFVGPFLFTYWAGLGFTNAWFLVKRSMSTEVFTPAMQAATAVLIIIALLFLLDGPTAFFDDPGYVGLCVAPGLELILPWLHGRTRTPQVDEDPPSLADG